MTDRATLAERFRKAAADWKGSWLTTVDVHVEVQDLPVIAAALSASAGPQAEAVRQTCAAICDKHAEWAESKIEDGDDPSSSTSQMWACMSNTANDLAEMIRKDLPPMGARVPKVRTSHHRNKEEAARLQALVDERYVHPQPQQADKPMAYWLEHPKFGMELSLDQLSEHGRENGWIEIPLYGPAK